MPIQRKGRNSRYDPTPSGELSVPALRNSIHHVLSREIRPRNADRHVVARGNGVPERREASIHFRRSRAVVRKHQHRAAIRS
jgi:hypothetical protein